MIFRNCYTKFHEPLGEWNLRQFWNITSGIYAKYHVQIMLLFVYTTTYTRFVIFTCRYFKLSWNTTALSQSNCRNFSCSSISKFIPYIHTGYARSAIFKFKGSFPRVSFRKWWLEIVNDGRRIISKGSVTIAKHGRQYVKREWQWCTLGYSQCQDLFSPTKKKHNKNEIQID